MRTFRLECCFQRRRDSNSHRAGLGRASGFQDHPLIQFEYASIGDSIAVRTRISALRGRRLDQLGYGAKDADIWIRHRNLVCFRPRVTQKRNAVAVVSWRSREDLNLRTLSRLTAFEAVPLPLGYDSVWRCVLDSNQRGFCPYPLSKRAHSTRLCEHTVLWQRGQDLNLQTSFPATA